MPRLSAVLVLLAVTMLVLGIHDITRGLTAASLVAPVDAAAAAEAPDAAVPDAEPDAEPDSPPESAGLTTDQLDIGTVVTTTEGTTLYRFDKDSALPSRSVCNGQCAATWPPLWATHGIPGLDGVDPALVGIVTRDDGNEQVTLAGWPLYRYAQDSPGEAQGNGFEGNWHVVAPDGKTVVAPVGEPEPGTVPRVAHKPAPQPVRRDQPKPVKKQSGKKKDEKKSSRERH